MIEFLRLVREFFVALLIILRNVAESAEWSARWALRIIFIYLGLIMLFSACNAQNSAFVLTIAFVFVAIWLFAGWRVSIPPFLRDLRHRPWWHLVLAAFIAILIIALGIKYATFFGCVLIIFWGWIGLSGFRVPEIPTLSLVILNYFPGTKKITQSLSLLFALCVTTGLFFSFVPLKLGWEGRVAFILVAITYLLFRYSATGNRSGVASKGSFATGWILSVMLIGGMIGWSNLKQRTLYEVGVVRQHIIARRLPSPHVLFPGAAGADPVAISGLPANGGKITVQPGIPSDWIERPNDSYRFAWDVERSVAPYLDTEREYIDGTTQIVNCLVEEEKPIAKVRFIHRGKSMPIKVKIWYSENPDI